LSTLLVGVFKLQLRVKSPRTLSKGHQQGPPVSLGFDSTLALPGQCAALGGYLEFHQLLLHHHSYLIAPRGKLPEVLSA
jgi:hypothetical protein